MWSEEKNSYLFPVSNELSSLVSNYLGSYIGAPGEINSFNRMLYFSAITITTTGYGDVLPDTDLMRLMVGLEAFIGTILSGAFLWWLIENATKDRQKENLILLKLESLERAIHSNTNEQVSPD